MRTIAFFNNKGGVGKTSLVYHLAWMYSELGLRVLAVDLDPQANLTSMFLPEERLEQLWPDGEHRESILGAINPIMKGIGDLTKPFAEKITDQISLVIGDLGLSKFEDSLSQEWPQCSDGKERAFRVITAFHRLLRLAIEPEEADLVLIDVGPNLGAINRSAMIAAERVVIPLAPDLFSLQGLRNLGPTLREWRQQWTDRKTKNPVRDLDVPGGEMQPAGYVILQHAVRLDRPVKAYRRWIDRIPGEYRRSVLNELQPQEGVEVTSDPYCLGMLKNYRSLMPLAMEARKPMFKLTPADGAIGSHASLAADCYKDFESLARKVAESTGISLKAKS